MNMTHQLIITDTPDVSLGEAHESIHTLYKQEGLPGIECFDKALDIIEESEISGSSIAFSGSFEKCKKYATLLAGYGLIHRII